MHCMYCGKDTKETKSREHVLSACFGGKVKLPLGLVCADCNEKIFSGLETYVSRESIFRLMRAFEGPGKRGSMGPKKAHVDGWTFGESESGERVLSYLFLQKPYPLPHIATIVGQGAGPLKVKGSFQNEEEMGEFFHHLKNLNPKEMKQIEDGRHLEEGEMIVLYNVPRHAWNHKGKRGPFQEEYFEVIRHPSVEDGAIEDVFQRIKANKGVKEGEGKRRGQVTLEMEMVFDRKVQRYFAKTLVNTLAYFEGGDLLEDEKFNEVKEFILLDKGDLPFQYIQGQCVWGVLDDLHLTEAYRHCLFYQKSFQPRGIIGIVSFYRMTFMTFIPYDWGRKRDLKFDMNGLFVDFKSGKESSFYDLLGIE